MSMPKHDSGRTDRRYTVGREFTGLRRPQYVARFQGEWIGAAALKSDAAQLARDHAERRAREIGGLGTLPLGSVRALPQSVRDMARRRPFFV